MMSLLNKYRPFGKLNIAALPTPSAKPAIEAPPAIVETVLDDMTTLRRIWFPVSLITAKDPSGDTVTYSGKENRALLPISSK